MALKGLSVINKNRRTLSGPQLLHDLIPGVSQNNVNAIEFLDCDGTLVKISYPEFRMLSGILSNDIRHRLLRAQRLGSIVPIIIPQCPELYIALRAVLETGSAFCTVGSDVPAERLRFILEDVNASLVIVLEDTAQLVDHVSSNVEILTVSIPSLQARSQGRANGSSNHITSSQPIISASSPAYIMYTSGSTGVPKGVKISHFSVTQSLLAHHEHIPNFKRFLQFASPTFDVSIFEIFFPFFRSATLVTSYRERMLSDLPGTIIALKADAAELTPTVAGTLLKRRSAAPCLQVLLTIGEMLTAQVVREFGGSEEQDSMLYAMYGPTEAAIHCTIAPKLAVSSSVKSIGRPLSTVTAYILKDGARSISPEIATIGEAGELAVSGQLADEYLNRPEQNEFAFIDFEGHGRIYRTGDRAVCKPDGQLEILGRMSLGQVKLRGQRVELGEIEEVASKAKGLHLAVASVIDDVLVLFCAAEDGVSQSEIHAICKSWLPAFMRPGEIVVLTSGLPRLPSGKVDKKKLDDDYRSNVIFRNGEAEEGEAFTNESERHLSKVLGEELSVNILRRTPLWSSGLNSLRAIKIASRLRRTYPNITVRLILETDSIADLARKLGEAQDQISVVGNIEPTKFEDLSVWQEIEQQALQSLPEVRKVRKQVKISPCSPMQIGMLTETMANPQLYFNSIDLQMTSRFTKGQIWTALQKLAQTIEILRSGFSYTGHPEMPFVQVLWPQLQKRKLSMLHPLQPGVSENEGNPKFTVQIHHALYDGWSWDLIMDDLNTILAGLSVSTRPSYTHFTSYQWRLQRSERERSEEYWNQVLEGCQTLRLPMLSACKSVGTERLVTANRMQVSYSKLAFLSEIHHLSNQSVLHAAWSIVLSAYLDSEDVVFGIVSSGRHRVVNDIDRIIGPCLCTLPLRVDLTAVSSFHDLLGHVQRQNTNALDYDNISLNEIQKASGLKSNDRLFDSLVVWQEGTSRADEQRKHIRTIDNFDILDYPIVIEVEPRDDHLQAKITTNTTIPRSQGNLILHQLDAVLSKMSSDLETKVREVWTGMNESIMSVQNVDYKTFANNFDLYTTIETLATSSPSKTAVRFVHNFEPISGKLDIESLSFSELYSRAMHVSSGLVNLHDVKPDVLVCVLAEKSINLYITILGTIMSGAGYMCIDPRTPIDRVARIIDQAKCSLVIIDENNAARELKIEAATTTIQDLLNHSQAMPKYLPRPSVDNDLAYAVFTSGSTGTPKGVILTRKNLLSNLDHLSKIYPVEQATDQLLQACSPAFDVSVFEIFWTWHMGMTLCAASNDVLFRDIEKLIDTLGVTHLSMTPSVAALIHPSNVPSVKMLVTAGESMNSKVFSAWAGNNLYQGYGPSETTNICNIRPQVGVDDAINNVGPVFANTSLFVCRKSDKTKQSQPKNTLSTSDFELLPIGATGEVWIGGDQVCRGYIEQHLTERSFMQHLQYGYLYRSGDIGRLLADGSLVVLGREDDQVKLRGQRIELGDINTVLINTDYVQDAVSIMMKEADLNLRLVSFWTSAQVCDKQHVRSQTSDVFKRLEQCLPSYMVPDSVVLLDSIPLTRQGKIDKRVLEFRFRDLDSEQREAFSRQSSDHSTDETPLTSSEATVAQILSKVLQMSAKSITRGTSFYSLGLDSINCIHFSKALRNEGYQNINVSTILQHPSLRQLAQFIDTDDAKPAEGTKFSTSSFDDTNGKITLRFREVGFELERVLPCTPLQEYMLAGSDTQDESSYHNTLRFEIRGDIASIRSAWQRMLQRHGLLRTIFVRQASTDKPFLQVILKRFKLPWNTKSQSSAFKTMEDVVLAMPYCLKTQTSKDGNHSLELRMHHALYDAEAMSVLLHEIESCYRGEELLSAPSFFHYLQYMKEMDVSKVDAFWQRQLGKTVPGRLEHILPVSRRIDASPDATANQAASVTLKDLEAYAKIQSTTVLAIFQCALARMVSCLLGSPEICFGNVFSGRALPIDAVERIVGPCFNTLPIRACLTRHMSNQELCHSMQQANLEILPYQPSSLRRIQRQNSTDGSSLFDVLLLLQHSSEKLDERIWKLTKDVGDMSFPFIFEILPEQETDSIRLDLHSSTSSPRILGQLLRVFDGLLLSTVNFPQARALDFMSIRKQVSQLPLQQKKASQHASGNTTGSEKIERKTMTDLESQIRDILLSMSVVHETNVTRNTTIFRLGLDSIHAVQIAAHLRKKGYKLNGADILEGPSIAQIASSCRDRRQLAEKNISDFDFKSFDEKYRGSIVSEKSLVSNDIESIRPCTATQSGILSQYLKSKHKLYFNTSRLQLQRNTNLVRLKWAWEQTMAQNEMLRTGFAEIDDPKIPFVMITYKQNTNTLPWTVTDSAKQPPTMTNPPILVEPTWKMDISQDSEDRYLELSLLHALYDAQSLDIILAEVSDCYYGRTPARSCPINPILSDILNMADANDAKDFWSNQLDTIEPTLFPDLRIHNTDSTNISVTLNKISKRLSLLKKQAANMSSSLQTACQIAWAKVLAAYTGQTCVTFGLVLSGRDFEDPEKNRVAFPCLNTLPIAIDTSLDPDKLLVDVLGRSGRLRKYQHTALTNAKRWLKIEDELFDTIFVMQKLQPQQMHSRPWTALEDKAYAEYTISLELLPDEDKDVVTLQLTSLDRLVPKEAAQIIIDQFEALLLEVLRIDDWKAESQYLLCSRVEPKTNEIPTDVQFLHELVERTARGTPDNPALMFVTEHVGNKVSHKTWTYSQLEEEGNRIAHLLLRYGVERGELIAVCFDKCAEASFAMLGVLKAGCAYVPLDPAAPTDRQRFILDDAKCNILLTNTEKADVLSTHGITNVIAVDDRRQLEDLPSDKPDPPQGLDPSDTCYCLYTSGTTGTPKGCLISHHSAVQAMMSFQRIFKGHWDNDSRWLQFASFHFDVSVLEQYWSWSVGICVVSAPRDILLEDIAGFIKALEITHLDLTPSLARLLDPDDVPSLCRGVFIVGGEQVSQDIIERWGNARCLYNFYGPSEVTIGCTVHPRVSKNAKSTNIGQPWDNVGALVLRPNTEERILRGGVGELCLSGPLVGKGYLNRQELTETKFVKPQNLGKRIYRSGDLVRLLHDNSFDFLGRIDDQIKLRGQRLEVGEINHVVLGADQQIKNVATMVLEQSRHGTERLVTFYTTSATRRKDECPTLLQEDEDLGKKIRTHCSLRLPGYMVPSTFLVVSFMPLSANNKVEHKTLKRLYNDISHDNNSDHFGQGKSKSIGTSRTLGKVIAILDQFFNIAEGTTKAHSRLFELGLDSISAISLSRRLRSEGFQNANVTTIMKHSTVIQLCQAVQDTSTEETSLQQAVEAAKKFQLGFAHKTTVSVATALEMDIDDIEDVAPCTSLQEGMIVKASTSSEDVLPPYFSEFNYDVSGHVDIDKLFAAWRTMQQTTSILRTHFVPTEDGFAQVVLKPGSVTAEQDPIMSQNAPSSRQSFQPWCLSTRSFTKATPWRVSVVHTWSKTYMSLFMFHGLYDGIALNLLLENVAKSCITTKQMLQETSNFYDLLPYSHFLQLPDAEGFWKARFPRVQMLNLPIKNTPRQKGQPMPRPRKTLLSLPGLGFICQKLNITTPALFHAAWLHVLSEIYDKNPTLGVVVSGRSVSNDKAENVIGPMFNTIPCIIEGLSENSTIVDLAKACHQYNIDALPFQHSPLRDIARWTGHDLKNGLFDSLFVFQKQSDEAYRHNLWRETGGDAVPDYCLNFEVDQLSRDEFALTFFTKIEYLDYADIDMLSKKLRATLERILREEHILISAHFQRSAGVQRPEANRRKEEGDGQYEAQKCADSWTEVNNMIRDQIAVLSGVVAQSLHLESPTLFELGLDSIDAMRLATRLKNVGVRIAISKIIQFPTIAGISKYSIIDGAEPQSRSGCSDWARDFQNQARKYLKQHNLDLSRTEVILPVTPLQEGLLLDFDKYYNIMTFKIEPEVDSSRLIQAWKDVVESVPILRTKFLAVIDPDIDHKFLQLIETYSGELSNRTVMMVEANDLSTTLIEMRSTASQYAFEAQAIHISVVKTELDENWLLTGMPHATYDAWSLNLLHSRVLQAYNGQNSNVLSFSQTSSYESYLQGVFDQNIKNKAVKFWQRTLLKVQPTILRRSLTRAANNQSLFLQQMSEIPWSEVVAFCKIQGISIQSLGLACWSLALAHRTRQSAVCFGVVLAGRTTEGADELIYPTFNTVIFHYLMSGHRTRSDCVKEIHKLMIQISEHQNFPLREATKIVRDTQHDSEIFDTLFTFQKAPEQRKNHPVLYREANISNSRASPPYAVNIEMEGVENQIQWTAATQEGVTDTEGLKDILSTLDHILVSVIRHPGKDLQNVSDGETLICDLHAIKLMDHQQTQSSSVVNGTKDSASVGQPDEWSEEEEAVRNVLAQVAKVELDSISKSIGFFNLGLDSISAIKVSGLLKKQGLKLPVSQIVTLQTVEKMAASLQRVDKYTNDASKDHEDPRSISSVFTSPLSEMTVSLKEVESIFPASAGQIYMLDLYVKSNAKLVYSKFWLQVQVGSTEIIERAFARLKYTIPILRTAFVKNKDQILQVVIKPGLAEKYQMPWTYATRKHRKGLLITWKIHHALYDAISVQIMLSALQRICNDPTVDGQLNTRFDDFIASTTPQGDKIANQKDFWTKYLAPNGRTAQKLTRSGTFAAARLERYEPRVIRSSSLQKALRRNGISLQAFFIAAYAHIHRLIVYRNAHDDTPQDSASEVIVGVYLANRSLDIDELVELVAPTFNIVPLKVNVQERDIIKAAKQVQEDFNELRQPQNCGVSLRDIYKWTGIKLDCYVNFLKLPDEVTHGEGFTAQTDDGEVDNEHQDAATAVRIKHVELTKEEKEELGDPDAPSPFFNGKADEASDDKGLDWCLPAIDIEAKVENGYLGVGVFAPNDVLDEVEVQTIYNELKDELIKVTDMG